MLCSVGCEVTLQSKVPSVVAVKAPRSISMWLQVQDSESTVNRGTSNSSGNCWRMWANVRRSRQNSNNSSIENFTKACVFLPKLWNNSVVLGMSRKTSVMSSRYSKVNLFCRMCAVRCRTICCLTIMSLVTVASYNVVNI